MSTLMVNLFLLLFFCQLILSLAKIDRILTIVKSMDDYVCRNYVWTFFFRQRNVQEQWDDCKSLLKLHSCVHYDIDSIRMCNQSILTQVKQNLFNVTPTYCFTSSTYKTFPAQYHLHSIAAIPRIIFNYQLFMFCLLFISFSIMIKTCC